MTADDVDVARLGERLYLRRKRLGLEQEQVAERASLSRAYVSRLENGRVSSPRIGDLRAVARALDMSLDELLDDGPIQPSSRMADDDERELERLLALPELAPEFAAFMRSYRDAAQQEKEWLLRSLRIIADRHNLGQSE